MRTLPILLAAAALSLPLAACQNEPETVTTRAPDPLAEKLANAAPVELPPPVKASVTFRCQPGNALAYVEFFQGDTQANFRATQGADPVRLRAPAAGEPFVAEGYSVAGDETRAVVTQPGQPELTCTA